MEEKKIISIVATAVMTDIENHFKGIVTFKGEGKKDVVLDYKCKHHPKEIDFQFTENEKSFEVKGPLPHGKNLFHHLDGRNKYLSLFSMSLIYSTIEHIINTNKSTDEEEDFFLINREDKIGLSADAFDLLLPL